MLVADKWIFIHNPKTGGTSITRALKPYGKEEPKQHKILWPMPPGSAEKVRFCVVRNPYNRLVSAYHHVYRGKLPQDIPDFNDWVLSPSPTLFNAFDIKRQSQYVWAHQCNHIIQFEHLTNQFNALCKEYLHIDVELEHYNKTERKPYQEYYEPKTIDVVRDRFGPDLERWDYEF